MKKHIALKPYNDKSFCQNKIFEIDTTHNIFFGLKKILGNKGVEINTIDLVKGNPDVYIYCDVPYPWEFKLWIKLIAHKENNILFVFESPIINPLNHFNFVRFIFKKIYTWDDSRIDEIKYFKFYIPQRSLNIVKHITSKKFLAALMVSKNIKVKYLLKLGNLLTKYESLNFFRERLIKHILEEKDCKFYGKGWGSQFSDDLSFGGEVGESDKFKIIGKYKYYFAIENASAPGYITEKIFDAFRAGVVPVYKGAPNVTELIPSNCFINIDKFNSISDVMNHIKNISDLDYRIYLKNINKFMKLRETRMRWGSGSFEKLILSLIRS